MEKEGQQDKLCEENCPEGWGSRRQEQGVGQEQNHTYEGTRPSAESEDSSGAPEDAGEDPDVHPGETDIVRQAGFSKGRLQAAVQSAALAQEQGIRQRGVFCVLSAIGVEGFEDPSAESVEADAEAAFGGGWEIFDCFGSWDGGG